MGLVLVRKQKCRKYSVFLSGAVSNHASRCHVGSASTVRAFTVVAYRYLFLLPLQGFLEVSDLSGTAVSRQTQLSHLLATGSVPHEGRTEVREVTEDRKGGKVGKYVSIE